MMHLPLDQMDKLTFQDPQAIRNFSMILMHTVRVLMRMVNDLQLVDPARRIAATIDRATLQYSCELPITQSKPGEMASATRRQVSIILKEFAARGWVLTQYGRLIIRDAAAMRAWSRLE